MLEYSQYSTVVCIIATYIIVYHTILVITYYITLYNTRRVPRLARRRAQGSAQAARAACLRRT